MTTYAPASAPSGSALRWGSATTWDGGVVPDAPDADVALTEGSFGGTLAVTVDIPAGATYGVRSLEDGADAGLSIEGTLAVAGAVQVGEDADSLALIVPPAPIFTLSGGTLDPGSLTVGRSGQVAGTGAVTVAGALSLDGMLLADGGALLVAAGSSPGYAAGTLGAGVIGAQNGGTLDLSLGGPIVTEGGAIVLGSGGQAEGGDAIGSYDPATGGYDPIGATLQSITGLLQISGPDALALANGLALSGYLELAGGTLSGPSVTVGAAGRVSGYGTVAAPIVNDGRIAADGGRLILPGAVGGTGSLDVSYEYPGAAVLELGGATAEPVTFDDAAGLLQLDEPAAFTGTIAVQPGVAAGTVSGSGAPPPVTADQVALEGVALASVTGTSFAAAAGGGVLTIQEGATEQTLSFAGDVTAGRFALSDGGGPGASLDITVIPSPTAAAPGAVDAAGVAVPSVITNSDLLTVGGDATVGASVSLTVDGRPAAVTYATEASQPDEFYTAAVTPELQLGVQQISLAASASNAAGAAQATGTAGVDLLPAPIDNVTVADSSSGDLLQLLAQGFAFSFIGGTQAVQLTNGTLSVGADTDQEVIDRLYLGLLGRPADPGGLVGFSQQLASGTGLATIADGLLASAEYAFHDAGLGDGDYVSSLYSSFLGRTPSAAELSGFVDALGAGEPRGAVAATFATADEAKFHLARRTADLWAPDAEGELVTQLYETGLGRDPGLSDLAAWKQQLSAGLTAQGFAQYVAASAEFGADHDGQSPGDFVGSLYQAGLSRTPSAADAQGWVGQIAAGAPPAAILLGIGTSDEAYGHLSPAI